MKMELTECSKTSAYKIQTPGIHTKERIEHSEHGESLKLRVVYSYCLMCSGTASNFFIKELKKFSSWAMKAESCLLFLYGNVQHSQERDNRSSRFCKTRITERRSKCNLDLLSRSRSLSLSLSPSLPPLFIFLRRR